MVSFKKPFTFFWVFIFVTSFLLPAYAEWGYVMAPQVLNQLGVTYYQQNRYADALHEFQKTLILEPDNEVAKRYIRLIKERKIEGEKYPVTYRYRQINEYLDAFEKRLVQTELVLEFPATDREIAEYLDRIEKGLFLPSEPPVQKTKPVKKEIPEIPILKLDSEFEDVLQPVQIEVDRSIIIQGLNVRRFLVTQPAVVSLEKKGRNEYLVSGKALGYTYIHVWDDNGRWTISVLGVPQRLEGLLTDEEQLLALEKEHNFKLRYSVNWSSFEQGESLRRLKRQTYSYHHSLGLTGDIPYGEIDSSLSLRSLREDTELTYFTIGLEEGRWFNFKDFSIRGFDYSPPIESFSFGSGSLRGVMFEYPAFSRKLNYTLFWGRESGSSYANLSPGLTESEDKFLSGTKFIFTPDKRQTYTASVFHGWGSDREDYLRDYSYDGSLGYNFDKWGFAYEIANDSEYYSHLLNLKYWAGGLNFSAELRDIDKDFLTIVGLGSRTGELGGLFNLHYQFNPQLSSSLRLDVFRDRLFPSLEDKGRWNQDLDLSAHYKIDDLTSLNFDYSLQNELGRVSQFRNHNAGVTLSHTFETIRKINSYITYRYNDVSNFTAPALDYQSNKLIPGLRFNLISDLYYYVNKEMSWTTEKATGGTSKPQAWETGLDWSGQLFNNPKSLGNFRLIYRDEEDTDSTLSFLSGEDYLEGYTELNYRPSPNNELFISGRVRNVWADNPDVDKRIEVDFRVGMRYLWDTGIRWRTVGAIEGIVYKDFNSDGLRQDDEPAVEGVKVDIDKDKMQITDIMGYYKFDRVEAKDVKVKLDTTTLPKGYVLTVPAVQSIVVSHGRTVQVNFGIVANAGISGMVFVDNDLDGKFSKADAGVRGVSLTLEDGSKATTDSYGRYFFSKASPGKHTVTLDLNSVSVEYLPQVLLSKEVMLYEGMIFSYNIPLRKAEE